LRELGGNLEIENWFGKGAAFTVRLPKTLSLTRILLIGCGTQLLAIPSAAVERVTDHGSASPISRREAADGEEAGALILDLGRLLGTRRPDKRAEGFIVVVSGSGRRLGLRVDSLFGFRDVVVKQYAIPRQALDVFAGAAILSDGQPCLVLQPARLLSLIPAGSATDAPPLTGTAKS
jgi:two-component system chemotaxis sensor kinase CheA